MEFDYKKPTVQLLGRWQPWHEGHTELFKRAHSKTGQVAIMVRESDRNKNNPHSFALRELFIKQALQREGYYIRKDFIVIPVPNIVNITYGRDVGYIIEQEVLDENIEAISATEIRNADK
jgi:nicotinamide mononucleotide adenylyltransferase